MAFALLVRCICNGNDDDDYESPVIQEKIPDALARGPQPVAGA